MILWLASYPRSGNTFLRVILNRAFGLKTHSIYNDPSDIAADEKTAELVGHTLLKEDFNLEEARTSDSLITLKTHDAPQHDYEDDLAIYIVRDGRQSTLSYAKYRQTYSDSGTLNSRLNEIIRGDDMFGTWGNHIRQWDPENRPNTLLIKFEDLIAEPNKHIDKLAKFLKMESNQNEIPTFTELHSVNKRFFRQGATDSWKTEFPDNLLPLFWAVNYDEMNRFGYSNLTPSVLKNANYRTLLRTLSQENEYLISMLREQRLAAKDDTNLELEKLRDESLQLTQKLAEAQSNLRSATRDRDALQHQAEQQKLANDSRLAESTSEKLALEKQISSLSARLAVQNTEFKAAQSKADRIVLEQDAIESQLSQLKSDLAKARESITVEQQARVAAESKAESTKAHEATLREELTAHLREVRTSHLDVVADLLAAVSDRDKIALEHAARLEKESSQVDVLTKEIGRLNEENASLSAELELAAQEASEYRENVSEFVHQNNQQQRQLADLRDIRIQLSKRWYVSPLRKYRAFLALINKIDSFDRNR